MGLFFKRESHDQFGGWALGYTAYGGPDVGEILAVAKAVGDGDDTAFHQAWTGAGDRLAAEADAALAQGHRSSASELYLRASAFYATSYHPLYGTPVDPRLLRAFRKQIALFDRGLGLLPEPVSPLRIPYEGTTLPGYLLPAAGREREKRPLVILTNGYDATVTELYFATAVAASRRGYHCLFFDGPGQGEMLIEHGLHLRADWEAVVRPVVDFALGFDIVDPQRVALYGWSLGGMLAARAAAGEPRLAACICDPGMWSLGEREALLKFGLTQAQADHLDSVNAGTWDRVRAQIDANAHLHWALIQRAFWVHGVDNLRDLFATMRDLAIDAHVERIRCATLLTAAENDPLARSAERLLAALHDPKTLLRFSAAEGAGEHCEMRNRSLLNRRVFDWLDATLQHTGASRR